MVAKERGDKAPSDRRIGLASCFSLCLPALALALVSLLAGIATAGAQNQHAAPAARSFQASASDIPFAQLSESNGLANPVVTCFTTDGDGFLWAGSQGGLQRWDGYRFWTYKQVLGSSDSVPDNLIQSLYTDWQGRPWIGTSSGGLAMYDRNTDSFVRYRRDPNDLNRVYIYALTGDGSRGLWVGSNTGLDHLDTDSGKFVHLPLAAIDGRQPQHASALLREADGTLWVGTDLGLERSSAPVLSNPQASAFQPVALPVAKGVSSEVLVLFGDREGRIWAGTPHGIFVIEQPQHAPSHSMSSEGAAALVKAVTGVGPGSEMLSSQRYLTIAQASDGEIWLGTQDEGVLGVTAVREGGPFQVRQIVHDPATPTSLSDNMVNALYLGTPGIMWAGTRRGISFVDTLPKSVFTIIGGPNRAIRDTNVYSVLGREDGTVWMATSHAGIDILDAVGHRIAEVPAGTGNPDATLPDGALSGLVEGGDGSVLLASQRGLYRVSFENEGENKRTHPSFQVKRLPIGTEASRDVTRILPDEGKLWIGSLNGLWVYDPATAKPATRPEMQWPLTDQRVTVLMKGEGNSIWIGTQNGLNRLDRSTHQLETILPDASDSMALGGGYISSLLRDRQGRLWVGTFSGGIDVLDHRDAQGRPRFRRIIDGLPDVNIDQLLEAADGKIWASTDGGLVVIDPQTFEMQVMHRADGAALPAYWNNSGAVISSGELVFGGIGGVTVVRPQLVKPWAYQPPVVVTSGRIGEYDIHPSRFNSGMEVYPIWIPSDHNNLTVEFTSLDYTAPEMNRYEYKLDGFDKDWIPANAMQRLARYTNLPPGDYLLELRGSNRDGIWAPARQIRVKVLPAWFQTWWFKFVSALAGLLLLYGVFLLATAYLRRQQRELERQVALRTAELEQMTVELKDSQLKLEHMAYTDALTGLPNRRMFNEHLKRLMALKRRQETSFALLLMDFDDFKEINDTYGHDAGDFVLIEMARRMGELVRESDCLARLGGDEFGLILGQSHDFEGTEMVCSKIIESFVEPAVFQGAALRTAPSIGIAIYPFDGDTQDKLYKAADLALYHAKRRGGNRCSWGDGVSSAAEVQ